MTQERRILSRGIFYVVFVGCSLAAFAPLVDFTNLGFTGAYIALAALPFAIVKKSDSTNVFSPYPGIAVLLYLYSLSTLLFVSDTGLTYFGETVLDADLQTYRIACLLAIAGLATGKLLAAHRRTRGAQPVPGTADQTNWLLLVAAILGVVALPFIWDKFAPWAATSYADTALSLRVDRLENQAAGVQEIIFETVPITLVLCAAVVLTFDRKRAVGLRAIAATVLGSYFLTTLLSGWRGQLMVALLIVTIYLHYKVRAIRPLEVILGGGAVYLIINVLSVARFSSNPLEMFQFLMAVIDERGFEFLALQRSGELATSTNLLRLIEGIRSNESQFGWGSIALNQILAFTPRMLYPDRPEFSSELFVKVFYPGVFESGGGYGFFMAQDGYWDFGLPGVFVYCAIFSFFVDLGYRWLRARFTSDLFVFLYALLYSQLVLSVIRNGIFSSMKAAMIASLPIMLLLVMIHLIRPASALKRKRS